MEASSPEALELLPRRLAGMEGEVKDKHALKMMHAMWSKSIDQREELKRKQMGHLMRALGNSV